MSRGRSTLCWLGVAFALVFAPGTGCLSRDESCANTSTCEAPGSPHSGGVGAAVSGGSGGGVSSGGNPGGASGASGESGAGGHDVITADGGAGAKAGDGGNPGGAGASAGQGGEGGFGACACPAWEFCHRGKCLSCSDTSSLSFGAVEALGRAGRYPRPTEQGELFYVQDKKIWYAPSVTEDPGVLLTVEPDVEQTEPLLRIGLDAVLPNQANFLLYQTTWDGNIERPLPKVARWSLEPISLTSIADAPPIFNSMTGYNFSVAASAQTNRAWWKRTGFDSVTGFVTAPLDGVAADVEAISIDVPVGSSTCPMDEYIPTAWVAEDGSLLLFRQARFDATCAHPLGAITELYAVPVDAVSGQPSEAAIALDVRLGARVSLTDPAFGPDCALYFSGNLGGSDQLYRAPRE